MKDVNIILGRFQPFTLGHLECVKQAFKKTGLDTVLAIIETPESKRDSRHPFTTDEIIPILTRMFKGEDNVIDYVTIKNADIAKVAEALHDKGYELASWTCGTDRYPDYSRQCKGYWEKAGLPKEPECIEVKRGDDDVSATKVRETLRVNDFDGFKKLMPKTWWSDFKVLQEIISKVPESLMVGKSLYDYIEESFKKLDIK